LKLIARNALSVGLIGVYPTVSLDWFERWFHRQEQSYLRVCIPRLLLASSGAGNRMRPSTVQLPVDSEERQGLLAEGLDPDEPRVAAEADPRTRDQRRADALGA
jgi:hypothetical protein